jgi:hypothetical protein
VTGQYGVETTNLDGQNQHKSRQRQQHTRATRGQRSGFASKQLSFRCVAPSGTTLPSKREGQRAAKKTVQQATEVLATIRKQTE